MKNTKLPDVPSELIQMALDDMNKCHYSDEYLIDFDEWHSVKDNHGSFISSKNKSICLVCFAGSVMAQTLGTDIEDDLTPSDFGEANRHKLLALDEFRGGGLKKGLRSMGLVDVDVIDDIPKELINVSQDDFDQFNEDMKDIITFLKSHNL